MIGDIAFIEDQEGHLNVEESPEPEQNVEKEESVKLEDHKQEESKDTIEIIENQMNKLGESEPQSQWIENESERESANVLMEDSSFSDSVGLLDIETPTRKVNYPGLGLNLDGLSG